MAHIRDAVTPALSTAAQVGNLGLQAASVQAEVDLKKANTVLAKTNARLRQALIPGAKAIETVTSELHSILTMFKELYGRDGPGYKKLLENSQAAVTDWLMKAHNAGLNLKVIVNNVIESIPDLPNQIQKSLHERTDLINKRGKITWP